MHRQLAHSSHSRTTSSTQIRVGIDNRHLFFPSVLLNITWIMGGGKISHNTKIWVLILEKIVDNLVAYLGGISWKQSIIRSSNRGNDAFLNRCSMGTSTLEGNVALCPPVASARQTFGVSYIYPHRLLVLRLPAWIRKVGSEWMTISCSTETRPHFRGWFRLTWCKKMVTEWGNRMGVYTGRKIFLFPTWQESRDGVLYQILHWGRSSTYLSVSGAKISLSLANMWAW